MIFKYAREKIVNLFEKLLNFGVDMYNYELNNSAMRGNRINTLNIYFTYLLQILI